MTHGKMLLIRDDDVNFFTFPDQLNDVYGFLFDNGIPVNFSVIPAVNASATTESADFGRGSYEPFLPPHAAGLNQEFPVSENQELKSFFLSLKGNYDILMHGFNHKSIGGRYEFNCEDGQAIDRKVREGLDILMTSFGVRPVTFVAPQDQYSQTALRCLKQKFKLFSLGWIDRRKLPFFCLPQYAGMKLHHRNYLKCGDLLMLEHPGCIFSKFRETTEEMHRLDASIEAHDITVIVVHHWEFYQNGILDGKRYNLFREKMLSLAERHSFIVFHELAKNGNFIR